MALNALVDLFLPQLEKNTGTERVKRSNFLLACDATKCHKSELQPGRVATATVQVRCQSSRPVYWEL